MVGLPAAYLKGRLDPGEPIQAEALGVVFLCAGGAIWLEVSFLLAGMAAGFLVVNLATHRARPFHEIEHIEWPFMVLFFVLAGAPSNLGGLLQIGTIGIAYAVFRTLARVIGGGGRSLVRRFYHAPALARYRFASPSRCRLGYGLGRRPSFP